MKTFACRTWRRNPDYQAQQASCRIKPLSITGMTAERKTAIRHALQLMKKGLHWGDALPRFTRDEMHDR